MTDEKIPIVLGHIGEEKHQSNVVYSADALSPTLDTVHGLAIVKVVVKCTTPQS